MSRIRGRRTNRSGIHDLEPILTAMHECRTAAVRVMTCYPIVGAEYQAAVQLNAYLNTLAETLTGNPHAHWTKDEP